MSDPLPPAEVVTDPDAVALLTDPARLEVFKPFVARAASVPEAAAALGAKPNSLLYQVRRLEHLGLLRHVGRRGREKLYRSGADAYYVPFDASHAETFEAMLRAQYDAKLGLFTGAYAHAMLHELGVPVGLGVRRDPVNGVVYSFLSPDGERGLADVVLSRAGPATVTLWTRLFLDHEDAKALQRELVALYGRYKERRGAQEYLVHLDLAPKGG